jgi:hypothetical protein
MRVKLDIEYKDYFTKLGMEMYYVNEQRDKMYIDAYTKEEISYVKQCINEIKK